MPHLAKITVPRPPYLGGNSWTLENLNEITVVFGKNGAGKSQLLRSIRDQNKKEIHYIAPERSGDIQFQPHLIAEQYSFETRANRSVRNIEPNYRESVLARLQAYLSKRGNIRSEVAPAHPGDLEALLGTLLPEFSFKIRSDTPPYQLFRGTQAVTDVNTLSSGETQVITMGLDVLSIAAMWELDAQPRRVMVVDEPDTHLHPDLQQRLAAFLLAVHERFRVQFIVASHSTTLLSAFGHHGAEKTSVIYLDNSTQSQSAREFSATLREVSTVLGGHVLMGPLFGVPLLLVEGSDDYQIWSQAPRHFVLKVAVIPCNGDEIHAFQKSLELVLSSLRDERAGPAGYALLDGDKGLPRQENQKHIRYAQLACHESENLYLCDENLVKLGITWAEASKAIAARAGEFGQKEKALLAASTADRKAGDFKIVISEIARILDPKSLPWTLRVGKLIGESRPMGQLAEFLGEPLVVALWGQPKAP